jgi:hypothetical protein
VGDVVDLTGVSEMSKARSVLRNLMGDEGGTERNEGAFAGSIVEMHGEHAKTFVIVNGDFHLHLDAEGHTKAQKEEKPA